jgi:hypothetical protein
MRQNGASEIRFLHAPAKSKHSLQVVVFALFYIAFVPVVSAFHYTVHYTESELGNLDRAYRGGGADESKSANE